MNFMFSWQEQYLTSECSERVRYCSCHENKKFISSRYRVISSIYYMASSVSRQDEPNRTLWLATRVLSFPLGTTCHVLREKFPQKPNNKSFIDQAFPVKMAPGTLASFFICEFMDLDSVLVHKHAKKNLPGKYPAILTSRFVNNPYLSLTSFQEKYHTHYKLIF